MQIPGVDLFERLGAGSFGSVLRGHHQALDVPVAAKLIGAGLPGAVAVEAALREARLMARIDHPNVLRIYDAGRAGDAMYLILEKMDGSLGARRRIPADELADIARQLLQGLQALHEAGIVHRDIKPANCLVRARDRRVKLADLGIAFDTSVRTSEVLKGTVPFMAPELLESPPRFGVASDLYALGMTLQCLAFEDAPFPDQASTEGLLLWIAQGQRRRTAESRPDLAPELAALVDRLIAPRPGDRPAHAGAALTALSAVEVVSTEPPAREGPAQQPVTVGRAVGPWFVGDVVHEGEAWLSHSATHVRTAAPARISFARATLVPVLELVMAAAERASTLDHPGVISVLDWGQSPSGAYVVTSPPGRSMHELVRAAGPRDEIDALDIAFRVAEVLVFLHQRGIVYQLVEPGAVVASSDAHSVQLGWPVFCAAQGTPAQEGKQKNRVFVPTFAAPEALSKTGTIEPSVDLWGLGELLHWLLAGRPAYAASSPVQSIMARGEPPPSLSHAAPTVTKPTVALVDSLLRLDPRERPASAVEVRDSIDRIRRRLLPFASTVRS